MTVAGINLRVSIDRCEVVEYTPATPVADGDVVQIGSILAIAVENCTAADIVAGKSINAVFDTPAPGVQMNAITAGAWTVGAELFWDADSAMVTDLAADGPFIGYALAPKVITTQTDALVRWIGRGIGGEALDDIFWEEEFIYQAIADNPAWTVVDVGDGTAEIGANANGGIASCTIAATDEAEDAGFYLGDALVFDIDSLKTVEYRAQAVTPGTGIAVVWGMAGAHNLDKDTVAQNAWFRLQANLVLLVETDDGTNDNDDGATGITLVTGTYYRFKIDFTETDGIRFAYKADTATDWIDLTAAALVALGITAFDMSNYTAGLQPYFGADKASGTGTASLLVDRITVRCGRT